MLFAGNSYNQPPSATELEVTLIGPGYGEAVLIHVGDNQWVLIDSCQATGSKSPAPLQYLADIGVNPRNVVAVIVSHWDDDHVRGLAQVVEECSGAKIVMSKVFGKSEFIAYAEAIDSTVTRKMTSGVREMRRVLQIAHRQDRTLTAANQNRRLLSSANLVASHGMPIELWTLSPSDEEFEHFVGWLARQLPEVSKPRRRAVPRIRNDLSVVAYVSVGADAMLFGGDLEEEGNPRTGWSAVLSASGRPTQKSTLFKIAHHGSSTGEHAGIWSDLLESNPVGILAPWKLGGSSLPQPGDVARIVANAPDTFATISLQGRQPRLRDNTVKKTIKERTKSFVAMPQVPGMLRVRKDIASGGTWNTELFGGAVHLSQIWN